MDDTGENRNDDTHNKIYCWTKTNERMVVVLPISDPAVIGFHGSCVCHPVLRAGG